MRAITKVLAAAQNYTKGSNKSNQYIVVHYVGAVSSALANAKNLQNNQTSTSAQFFTDANNIIQTVECSDIAWGCSATVYKVPARNSNSIHIEMCCKRTAAGVWYIEETTIKNTAELVAQLMQQYSIPITSVLRHYDVTGKHCPEPFVRLPSLWTDFINEVKLVLTGKAEVSSYLKPYRVRLSANDAASQIGAFTDLGNAQDLADRNPGYEVYDKAGALVYDPVGKVQQYTTYQVAANDSWWSIAAKLMKNGLLMYELAAFNGLTIQSIIHPGKVIKIPIGVLDT